MKNITYNWKCFQESLIWAFISYPSFPCFQPKSCRQGWKIFCRFPLHQGLFMNFDHQKNIFTATPVTMLWFVTTNWSSNHCTNCCNLFEFFWLCSELPVAITTTINKVLSLARASLILRNSPISKRFFFDELPSKCSLSKLERLITNLGIYKIEYFSVVNVFWQASQDKMIVDVLKLYFQLWRNVQSKLPFILPRQTTDFGSVFISTPLIRFKNITCNWNYFQKSLKLAWISYLSFPCLQSKSCRQGWELFYRFPLEHKLFMNFYNQK